ncbi:NACHT domain-containing protein [Micromonospora sp. NPDC049580]|uniref:NACHT domain-containing protein n=1 Tax=Micromonospora sp. NPDC049580 TaxID=3154832 RepID=UPI00341A8D27
MPANDTQSVIVSHSQGVQIGHGNRQKNVFIRAIVRDQDVDPYAMADQLAIAVQAQWQDEAGRRRLNDPYALPVSWQPADQDLFVSWPSIVRLATSGGGWPDAEASSSWLAGPDRLAGSDGLLDVFLRIPTRRLVVLGPPGSGKTVLLVRLILDLLARRTGGQPVPVLFSLASWNPLGQSLYAWMEHELHLTNPALAARMPHERSVTRARAMIRAGLILPLLDGLDEMPEGMRPEAITAINEALRAGSGIVIASRTDQFRQALGQPDGVEVRLAGATGIGLNLVPPTAVAQYLEDSAGGKASTARWQPVRKALHAQPANPVAQALSTPLMATLARTLYNPRPNEAASGLGNPAELVSSKRFPTKAAIEAHLFDGFIPAAYRPPRGASTRERAYLQTAQKVLAVVARDLEMRQGGTSDLAWWELRGLAPKWLAGTFVGILAGGCAALTIPWRGWGIGLIVAVITGLALRPRFSFGWSGLGAGLSGGLIGGELAAVIAYLLFGPGAQNIYVTAFVAGGLSAAISVAPLGRFVLGVPGGFLGSLSIAIYERASAFDGVRAAVGDGSYFINGIALSLPVILSATVLRRRLPARGLRWSAAGCATGTVAGLVFGAAIFGQSGARVGVPACVLGALAGGIGGGLYEAATPTDITKAVSPAAVLTRDRATFFASMAVVLPLAACAAITTAMSPPDPFNGSPQGIGYGVGVGVSLFVSVGLAIAFYQASWGGFALSCCWLWITRRTPLRVMGVLEDAHVTRGVLRQSGAVYQFRHVEIQRRLANHVHETQGAARDPAGLGFPRLRGTR